MSVRIIHAADLHLDSPFEGLDGDRAALRRAEQRALPETIVRRCEEQKADLLLLCGDLLDSGSIYTQTGEALLSALSRVDIPVFIAPGNHDWYSRRSPYARLAFPENVHIFSRPALECAELPGLGVRVWGAGYTANACPPLLRDVRISKREGWLDILALHAEVGRKDSPYCPVTEEELARSGFDYAALGHIHTLSGLRRAGGCVYAWPGCPEGRGFDECGRKGILQADVSAGKCELMFLPMGGREYRKLTVEAGEDARSAVETALPQDAKRHIYRIILSGECVETPDLQYLRQALSDRVFHLQLVDETRPARDIWERAGEDTLTGAFLRRMRLRLEAAKDSGERAVVLDALRLGLAALEGRELRL